MIAVLSNIGTFMQRKFTDWSRQKIPPIFAINIQVQVQRIGIDDAESQSLITTYPTSLRTNS